MTHDAVVRQQIGRVFARESWLPDHRSAFPWVTGFLGDPLAPVWFVAENPSLGTAEGAGHAGDANRMWNVSPGDKLFRETLVQHGFKTGRPETAGGWRCYLTDVVKSAHYADEWSRSRSTFGRDVAIAWSPVLACELRRGKPKLIVAVGQAAEDFLRLLERSCHLPVLPPMMRITHYSARRGVARQRYPQEFKALRRQLSLLGGERP